MAKAKEKGARKAEPKIPTNVNCTLFFRLSNDTGIVSEISGIRMKLCVS